MRAVVEKFVPTVAEAIDLVQGRVCLVDGTITPCWFYAENDELWSRKHGTTGFNAQLVGPARRRRHLHLRPAAGMHPRRERHFATTPVAEIVAHSVAGSWIKAQGHQRWRSDLLCAATERGTLRTRAVRGDPCQPTLARWRGDRGHRLGRTQQCCFYEEGSPSTGGSDSGAER